MPWAIFVEVPCGFLLQACLDCPWWSCPARPSNQPWPTSLPLRASESPVPPGFPCPSSSPCLSGSPCPSSVAQPTRPFQLPSGRAGLPRRCAEQPPGPQTAVTARATWSARPPTSAYPCLTLWMAVMWLWKALPAFTNLVGRGNMLRNGRSCRTKEVAEPSFRISGNRSLMTARMGWMQWNAPYTWKKVSVSHYWSCTHRPLTKNDPHLCDFDTHCLKE